VVPNLYLAPNTLTQRMEGPTCMGTVCIDYSHMKDGDCAGFAAFNGDSGVLILKRNGKKVSLEMSEQAVQLTEREKAVTNVDEKVIESVSLSTIAPRATKVYLRIDADFNVRKDVANFFYSIDGQEWTKIGTSDYRMVFDYRRFFMGSKFAIFNYATKRLGGYVDVDCFEYNK
jgi:beta-xylosidase